MKTWIFSLNQLRSVCQERKKKRIGALSEWFSGMFLRSQKGHCNASVRNVYTYCNPPSTFTVCIVPPPSYVKPCLPAFLPVCMQTSKPLPAIRMTSRNLENMIHGWQMFCRSLQTLRAVMHAIPSKFSCWCQSSWKTAEQQGGLQTNKHGSADAAEVEEAAEGWRWKSDVSWNLHGRPHRMRPGFHVTASS